MRIRQSYKFSDFWGQKIMIYAKSGPLPGGGLNNHNKTSGSREKYFQNNMGFKLQS
jgi:hypothetical protein